MITFENNEFSSHNPSDQQEICWTVIAPNANIQQQQRRRFCQAVLN